MSAIRILLIEPDPFISGPIESALRKQHYEVHNCRSGAAVTAMLVGAIFQLVVLDRQLPDMDGCDLCYKIRESDDRIPLLMISRFGRTDVLECYEAGVDDYLPFPFDHREFLARVRVTIRRAFPGLLPFNMLCAGDIVLDLDSNTVKNGTCPVSVISSEFLLLEYMIRNRNRIVSKEELASQAFRQYRRCSLRRLAFHMSNLRKKLQDGCLVSPIYTVSGKGYLFADKGIV